jgi:hypothetical protein
MKELKKNHWCIDWSQKKFMMSWEWASSSDREKRLA